MLYHSTKSPAHTVGLKEAILRSLPADNGLYMPERLPVFDAAFWQSYRDLPLQEIGSRVAQTFFGEDVPAETLDVMARDAFSFDVPVRTIGEGDHIAELFHGPTLAFKDFGARFMARLMGWLTRDDDRELTVLAATSGDTGGAVASAFHGVEGTRVVILYPKGKVSGLQEKQLTTLGGNITALEIDGSFDDCQRLVKSVFLNRDLAERANLTSANSINWARLVPQSIYYIHSARLLESGAAPVFVIPSGNFGNLTAGLLAQKLGLPVKAFVAATNANDVVPRYLESGSYEPRQTVATISNAMDVGAPSNFARMQALFGDSWEAMRGMIRGYRFTDAQTREAIRAVHAFSGYVLDPHGAVGWLAAREWRQTHPGDETILLETAHPAKFADVIEQEIGASAIEIPERLACLASREKVAIEMPADEQAFAAWLSSRS